VWNIPIRVYGNQRIFKAVDSVSFNLYPGEILGLVGESGCGKTTLSRALLRLNTQSRGEIIFKGINLISISAIELRKLRPRMQLIFQDPYSALNPRITAGQAIREVLQVHFPNYSKQEREDQVDELFIQTGLDPGLHKQRYPHEFSGGQRQRICISRALATQPELLICDESVSALDVSVQAQILNLLNDLKDARGFACIFISHDLQVVRYMSDRILVMKDGKIVEEGITEEVCAEPGEAYTKSLLEAVPAI
jgi:peptide/nickel transport system ATP-binding protein